MPVGRFLTRHHVTDACHLQEVMKPRGLAVTEVERTSYLMPRIDSEMAALRHQHLASHNVDVKLNARVTRATAK